jgi:multidrug efflux pump subunit AcrA (membrane-fusion protein)
MLRKIVLMTLLLIVQASAFELVLSGSVVSDNQKMITSRYMGHVKTMAVAEGDIVKKGQLLYEIDSKEIEAAERQVDLGISQARLALQMNKSQYTNILTNLARHQRLYSKNMVSKYELETLQLAATNLKDMVEIAQQQVAQAQAKKRRGTQSIQLSQNYRPQQWGYCRKETQRGRNGYPWNARCHLDRFDTA